jgi:ankyrin repeat protein
MILFVVVALTVAALDVSASTIHQASAKGDLLLVKTLIKNTPSLVSERDERDVTPLHLACFYGQRLVVRFLLSAGAPIDAVTKSGYTPLLWAAWRKHTPVVKILLSKGANVNAQSNAGMTPLHFAIQNGDKVMAELLLNNGADTSAKDSLGQTAADLARKSKTATLIALFKKVSEPDINETKQTEIAKNTLKTPVPVVTELPVLNNKPAVTKPTAIAQPVKQPKPVVSKPIEIAFVPKRVPVKPVKPVIHRSTKPEPKVVLTRSIILAVLAAAKDEKPASFKFVLDRKPGLRSAIDRNGATLMHWLAEADWPEGIEMFVKAGGNINARKTNGVTPLQVAAALGKIKALDTLIGLGAKPSLEDSKGRTALSIAQERGQEEASDLLMNKP